MNPARVQPEVQLRKNRAGFGLLVTIGMASAVIVSATPAQAEGTIVGSSGADTIPNSYVVVFKDDTSGRVVSKARELGTRFGAAVGRTFDTALRGFSATMTEQQARHLSTDPSVRFVERNKVVRLADVQQSPPWGLDRIDQWNLPLNNTYKYSTTAQNVNVYVVDTGVRISHSDFGGRAHSGYDSIDNDNDASDCNGHGTNVAGTIGGAHYGVAKAVQIYAVRVLDCDGNGSTASVVAGIDWVTKNAIKPAVVNMSLSGDIDDPLEAAVRNSVAAGITYAVAAGNGTHDDGKATDACGFSPARLSEVITVSATDRVDRRANFANYGSCVDIFAPGVDITSDGASGDTATSTFSGTSQATPHVAGAAALYLARNPSASPREVRDALLRAATSGTVLGAGSNSPNKLLYTN